MSIFNLKEQNKELDYKIVAGLERLSQVFRSQLWEKAKTYQLSPIQIQLLIFLQHHSTTKATVSYMAQEFHVTKPTISDAIKILEQKKLLSKFPDPEDSRSYTMQLTTAGSHIVAVSENYVDPITQLIAKVAAHEKMILWETICSLITQLNAQQIISVQRTCLACQHHRLRHEAHFCSLLDKKLEVKDIRLDCPEFEKSDTF
ncbi:helix-turn-helix domain-containing protein [Arenibacter sp. GZD96]|uniref:MarR family winged helix-turn-helix transcriptional regulator n=1 Tax=Aurantibrevibacter litoralis TaxID=3106030 RepID=UPI002AFFBA06|nr:helix-turn-helix domain-containing protein [Arenibacter sp. GZD-96]MEA1785029.1 helix-turn-helix domain-containing protein [Arenibacter sp. GZD-96]